MSENASYSSLANLLLVWQKKGMERLFAMPRCAWELVTLNHPALRKSLPQGWPGVVSPFSIVVSSAVEGATNLAEFPRVLLHLAQQENEIATRGVQERVTCSAAVAVTERLRRTVDTFTEMQQECLAKLSNQLRQSLQAPPEGKALGAPGSTNKVLDTTRELFQAQARLLKAVVDDLAGKDGRKQRAVEKTPALQLVREAARCLIEAQKELLVLTGRQVDVGLNFTARVAEWAKALPPRRRSTLAKEEKKVALASRESVAGSETKVVRPVEVVAKAKRVVKSAPRRRRMEAVENSNNATVTTTPDAPRVTGEKDLGIDLTKSPEEMAAQFTAEALEAAKRDDFSEDV